MIPLIRRGDLHIRALLIPTFVLVALVLVGCSSTERTNNAAPTNTAPAPNSTSSSSTPTTTIAPTTVAPTTTTTATIPPVEVITGAQALANDEFARFDGQRIGLIAHQNSIVEGGHLSNVIAESPNVELTALFAPEHGVRGDQDAGVFIDNEIDEATNAPVFSLFGPTRKPTPEMLTDVDVLFYDLQDVGTRYYTYISTMGLAMQAANEAGIPFVVLDRPNPLGGRIGGAVLEPANTSFVGQYAIPDVYGLTSGELATYIVDNFALDGLVGLDLEVIELDGWDHSMVWNDTNLRWIAPSPAITSTDAASLYPATIYFEATNLSYGRGTEIPFQIVGAPWLNAEAVAAELNSRGLDGVRFNATTMTPELLPGITVTPAFLDETLPAVQLVVVDHTTIAPTEVGVHLLEVIFAEAAEVGVDPLSRPAWLDQLSGGSLLRDGLTAALDAETIIEQQSQTQGDIVAALEAARLYD